jgi:hypothetical protein
MKQALQQNKCNLMLEAQVKVKNSEGVIPV